MLRSDRFAAVLLLCGGFLGLTLPHLGAVPIERAEIYFLDAARAMVERADYLVPRYQGEAFYDKPALTYWLMAGSFRLFGITLGAGRIVSVLAATGCLLVTGLWARRLFGGIVSLAAATILATTLAFVSFARLAMSDMLLCFFVTLTVAGASAWASDERRPITHAVVIGAALGCGFLTKGPIALVLAGAGLLALAATRPDALRSVRPRHLAAAAGAFAACGLPWFVALWLREGTAPLRYFFLQENLERFAGGRYDAHRGPLYYLGVYLAEGLPWSLFLPAALVAWWREPPSTERRDVLALLVWMIAMLAPLTLSRGKIDYYILPLYPAASLVVARFLVRSRTNAQRKVVGAILVLLALLCVLAIHFVMTWTPLVPQAWLPGGAPRLVLPVGLGVAVALLARAAWKHERSWTVLAPAAASALVFGAFAHTVLPAFRRAQPTAAAVADIGRELRYRPDAQVAYCEDPARLQRDVLFEVRVAMTERCDLLAVAASETPTLFLLTPEERAFLSRVEPMRDVSEYRFLPATVATLDGLAAGIAPRGVLIAANYATEDPVAVLKAKKERRRAIRAILEQRAGEQERTR